MEIKAKINKWDLIKIKSIIFLRKKKKAAEVARKFRARRCAREKANLIISFLLLFQKYQIEMITNAFATQILTLQGTKKTIDISTGFSRE